MTLIVCFSLNILSISDRLKIPYFDTASYMTNTRSIVVSLLLGFMWPVFPLLGWSHYSLEGNLTSCSIEWAERSVNVISYNVTIFICVLIIPVTIIVYCDIKLVLKVLINVHFSFKGFISLFELVLKIIRLKRPLSKPFSPRTLSTRIL